MTAPYLGLVSQLRTAFPAPVSDRVHDAYFVFSFLRALDKVDALKSAAPMLGSPVELDYDAARRMRVPDDPSTLEAVTEDLVHYLSGMFIWGHPRAQINVVPSPTIPSIIGGLLPSIYNPNLVSEESSRQVLLAEVEALAMTAELMGYDAELSDGVFTFGGTGTMLYAAKIGLEKAVPGVRRKGLRTPAVIVCSERAHYACLTVANWLGIGEENVVLIPATDDNQMQVELLAPCLRDIVAGGRRIACIVATMGTTDAFGLDDLAAIVRVRDEIVREQGLDYVPHVHADAVIGWAWSVFNDYDWDVNALGFRHRTVRALAGTSRRIRHLALADSIGVDFHKTGFTPYISSAVLLKDKHDFARLTRADEDTPYIFQSGERHPGKYTLETSRSGSGPLAALANLRLFGTRGLQAAARPHRDDGGGAARAAGGALGHDGDERGQLRPGDAVPGLPGRAWTPSARPTRSGATRRCARCCGATTTTTAASSSLIQADALQGKGVVISLTDCYRTSDYGEPINALKSYILSPFSETRHVQAVLDSIWKARREVEWP